MYDLAIINSKPGRCEKCSGTGEYRWGGTINGKPRFTGSCHSCRGTGKQTKTDMRRNSTYNQHKITRILSHD